MEPCIHAYTHMIVGGINFGSAVLIKPLGKDSYVYCGHVVPIPYNSIEIKCSSEWMKLVLCDGFRGRC